MFRATRNSTQEEPPRRYRGPSLSALLAIWILTFTTAAALGVMIGLFLLGRGTVYVLYAMDYWESMSFTGELRPTEFLALAAVGIIGFIVLRYLFLQSLIGWGILLGIFLWVPFGQHALAFVPSIELMYPTIRVTLDTLLLSYPQLQDIQIYAETVVPVPEPAYDIYEPSYGSDPEFIEDRTKKVGTLNGSSSRLPQITD